MESVFDWQAAFAKLLAKKKENAANPFYVPIPPNPFFKLATETGLIQIGFSNDVFVVPNL